ncbi:MAG: hypothetical protein H0V88_00955 [Pyrinomonadaceae bacterium]|nr:hypothetical protein [Pyrinomonadaceae bacterium]
MKTDREKHDLGGHVKSIHVATAEFKEENDQFVEKPWFSRAVTFDREGNIIEYINRNPDGTEWRTVNDYSVEGKLLTTRSYDPSGQPGGGVNYVYDSEGRLIAEQIIAPDGALHTPTTYSYEAGYKVKTQISEFEESDDVGMLIGIEETNTSIGVRSAKRIETRYDERDKATEIKIYNADGALVARVEIKRDERGNPLEETQYIGDVVSFTPCASDSCSAEQETELTEEQKAELETEVAEMFAPGAVMSKQIHKYDRAGRLVESTLTMMGMNAGRQTFGYDEFGNKSEEVNFDEDGTIRKAIFTREYDKQGNWTKEIVSTASAWDAKFGLSIPSNVTRRTITYHEN